MAKITVKVPVEVTIDVDGWRREYWLADNAAAELDIRATVPGWVRDGAAVAMAHLSAVKVTGSDLGNGVAGSA